MTGDTLIVVGLLVVLAGFGLAVLLLGGRS